MLIFERKFRYAPKTAVMVGERSTSFHELRTQNYFGDVTLRTTHQHFFNQYHSSTAHKAIATMSVLLNVFLLQLFLHSINHILKPYIADTAWLLFTKLPLEQSKQGRELNDLRREVVRLNREMNATSAQDEFSKWAKLRRQHDKAKERYDAQCPNLLPHSYLPY